MGRQDEIIKERLRKLSDLKNQKINPYSSESEFTDTTSNLQEEFKDLKNEKGSKAKKIVSGRLMSYRDLGKIAFGTLDDGSGTIQIVLQDPETPKKVSEFMKKYIDSGDFIQVSGTPFRTKRGELSIIAKELVILTKSILPLPDKYHGLQDSEEKLRKRYLDILTDPETKAIFERKSKFWNTVRSFLLERDFLEVETPVLETSAGGAAATPFETHHNALDTPVFLRISMGELWQKRLMAAGYRKTFEIGRQFRNEGMDAEHLQDYTQMEFYWAYANYKDGMELTEELYKKIAKEVYGKTKFTVGNHTFDLSKKWKVIEYSKIVKEETGIDVFKADQKQLESKLKELKEPFVPGSPRARLIDLLWKYCRRKISGPAFLTGQPVEVSPLAKRSKKDPRTVEQFQIILAGSEMGNGYSELNDPMDQAERFEEQQKMKESGDEEAQSHDFDFVEMLKYGMPPTCGFGFSERLFAMFEGKPIRETVIFPLMKPESTKEKKSEGGKKNG